MSKLTTKKSREQVSNIRFLVNPERGNTAFIFRIDGIDDNMMNVVNTSQSFNQLKDKLKSFPISFQKVDNTIFENNLIMVDEALPNILGDFICLKISSDISNMNDLVKLSSEKNRLNFDLRLGQDFYGHKIKRFLTDCAFGLLPNVVWRGVYDMKTFLEFNFGVDFSNNSRFENFLLNNSTIKLSAAKNGKYIYKKDRNNFLVLSLDIQFS